jgi:hypothetical protein
MRFRNQVLAAQLFLVGLVAMALGHFGFSWLLFVAANGAVFGPPFVAAAIETHSERRRWPA